MEVVSCENIIQPMIQDRAGVGCGTVSFGEHIQRWWVRRIGDGVEDIVYTSAVPKLVNRFHAVFCIKSPYSGEGRSRWEISRITEIKNECSFFIGKREGNILHG